jgi:hypothetical protein
MQANEKMLGVLDMLLSSTLDFLVQNVSDKAAEKQRQLPIHTRLCSQREIGNNEIQNAVRSFPGEVAKHADAEGSKALTKFTSSDIKSCDDATPSTGLVFSAKLISEKACAESGVAMSLSAAVYLAAALQYICGELMELSGNASSDRGSCGVISVADLQSAVSPRPPLNQGVWGGKPTAAQISLRLQYAPINMS